MLSARDLRIPPAKDTKQLTSWNSLAIRGLAEAGFYLNRPDWLEAAKERRGLDLGGHALR